MATSFTCLSSTLKCPQLCSTPQKLPPLNTLYPILFMLLSLSLFSISLLLFTLFKRLKKAEEEYDPPPETSITSLNLSLSNISDKTKNINQSNSTRLVQSILFEVLPSNSPKWSALYSGVGTGSDSGGEDGIERNKMKKKKKRKGKKQEANCSAEDRENEGLGLMNKEELVCLYPFTSSSSATQRKIKRQYEQLVKSYESNGLNVAQFCQFVNCLVDAKNELQHKSEGIKRKFTITKALLLKADRSSFDRLQRQINKIELEQKRLEEDAFVYNWLQHQLKLSPAYKKMRAWMELKAKSGERTENPNSENAEQNNISFEEFLEKEKKDTFWQKYSKPKSCSG